MRKNIKRVGFVAVSGLALTSVGVAIAAWTATGEGDAQAQATNAQDTLDVTATNGGTDLVPGGTADVGYTVTRTTDYAVKWTTLTATLIESDKAGCGAADVVFGTAGVATVAHGLAKDVASDDFTIPGALAMIDGAADACQDALFTITVDVS